MGHRNPIAEKPATSKGGTASEYVREPFALGEHRMHMTCSIGISHFPSHGRTLINC